MRWSRLLSARVERLEDVNAIRKLHYAYGYYIDVCMYDEVVDLFARDGEAIFLSGIYRGREGVTRLYKTWFQNFFTGGKPGPVDGFLLDHFQMQDIITVADHGASAQGRFRALLAGGSHDSWEEKPEGLPRQFWEAGVYENDYVREEASGRSGGRPHQWQADYEAGWATRSAPQPSPPFPNPLGPDELLDIKRPMWPKRAMSSSTTRTRRFRGRCVVPPHP